MAQHIEYLNESCLITGESYLHKGQKMFVYGTKAVMKTVCIRGESCYESCLYKGWKLLRKQPVKGTKAVL